MSKTESLWPEIRIAHGLVLQAAHVLSNHDELDGRGVRRQFMGVLKRMANAKSALGPLAPPIDHFINVAHNYGPGLFHCYDFDDLPRTNNLLEQYFGSARYHERRISGHKVNSPGTVVRGPARLLAAVATRLEPPSSDDLRPRSIKEWRGFRASLERRHDARRKLRRFRRDPHGYLSALETRLLKPLLPP